MFENDLIREGSFKTIFRDGENYGFSFFSRVPYYRAIPLSCIESVNLTVNDEGIDPANITLVHQGKEYRLDELPPLMHTWWGFTEDVTFNVKNIGAPWRGNVELDLTVKVRMPFLIPSDGVDRPNYDTTRAVRSFKVT